MRKIVTIVLAAMVAATPAIAHSTPEEPSCRASSLPVQLELDLPPLLPGGGLDVGLPLPPPVVGDQDVFVRLCLPAGETPSTVQLLVHGITYSHRYWDIPDPTGGTDRYSWVAAATERGYATLAIDRIGIGQSSHPLSALIDMDQNAYVVHQVVRALRAGVISGPNGPVSFDKVVLVGHSYGSWTSWFEASRSHDVDGVVVTGATHNVREIAAPLLVVPNLYPAAIDPQFPPLGLDPGYLTSRPGARDDMFYAPSTDYDPAVVAEDEATKQTVTGTELANYPVLLRTQLEIRVPAFILVGDKDGLFCSQDPGDLGADCSSPEALIAGEAPWYGPDVPCIDAFVTPNAGHDLNAMFSSEVSFAAALDWLDAIIAPGPETPGCG
ncbi:MAG: alpha/beta fold hydrolase [Acidimicrobiales bacterium]